jgi:tight adherence protein C
MALKLGAAVVAALAGIPFGTVLPGRLGIAAIALAPAAGFMAPDLWLARRARERAEAIRRELPAMLDLLRVSVEAGLSLGAALGEVGERTRGPLAREWRAVGGECALGVPLSASLAALVRRAPLPEVEALSSALTRAARHGAPLAATLEAQARDARLARRRRIQEQAAKAAPKIQLVVALLLVPSVLLLVAAALAAALLGNGSSPI